MIGLSLPKCICDVAAGKVRYRDVEKIFSATKCKTDEDWEKTFESYCVSFWSENPRRLTAIARALLIDGRIEQPILTRKKRPDSTKTQWVKREIHIRWIKAS